MGILSDRIGNIPVLTISMVVFAITASRGYYLTSLPAIQVGGFILGIGIAGIFCTISTLIICYYEGLFRARVLGYHAAAMGSRHTDYRSGRGICSRDFMSCCIPDFPTWDYHFLWDPCDNEITPSPEISGEAGCTR
ncbi:MAG: hypothetical protein WCF90_04785 [Methanomicrobiales archaeon]